MEVRRAYPRLQQAGAAVAAVSFEPPTELARFARTMGLPFPVLSDPTQQGYAAFGLRRGKGMELMTLDTTRAYMRGMLKGYMPRPPRGDTQQMGGDFVIDTTGTVIFSFRGKGPGDRPSLDDLLSAVEQANAAQRKTGQR